MTSVAIIGAGPSGLALTKEAVAVGLLPTVIEKATTIGGLWRSEGGSAWTGMHTNLSRYSCVFSDFPWDSTIQEFPTQREVYEYLLQYARAFDLNQYIHFSSEVLHIEEDEMGWKVLWIEGGEKISRIFQYVVIATGIFSEPYIPPVPGMDGFSGKVLHSREYKDETLFHGKNVVIVGNAFSGSEIASSLVSVANRVTHVFRHPFWVIPHYPADELPLDFLFYRRSFSESKRGMSEESLNLRRHQWFSTLSRQEQLNTSLKVEVSSAPTFVTISNTYLNRVEDNSIILKKASITEIRGNEVIFDDNSSECPDVLLFATGYRTALPFLSPLLLQQIEFRPEDSLQSLLLHQCTWPLGAPNIAFAGMYRGPFFGVIELQARWITQVFAHIIPTPTQIEIAEGVEKERIIRDQNPRPQFPHGNYEALADGIAAKIDALPNLHDLQQRDQELYNSLWTGPYIPAHFRLTGFGSQPALARRLIQEAEERSHRSAQRAHDATVGK